MSVTAIIIAFQLSAQTKDQVTLGAMVNLKNHGLTVQNVINTPLEQIDQLIQKVLPLPLFFCSLFPPLLFSVSLP